MIYNTIHDILLRTQNPTLPNAVKYVIDMTTTPKNRKLSTLGWSFAQYSNNPSEKFHAPPTTSNTDTEMIRNTPFNITARNQRSLSVGRRWGRGRISRFTSMECSMEVGGSRFTSMEVGGSFHGNTWEVPRSVVVEASFASINCSFQKFIPRKLPWVSIPTYFHLLPRVSQTSSSFHKTSIRVHRYPSDLLLWSFPPISMETSVEVFYFHASPFICVEESSHGRGWNFSKFVSEWLSSSREELPVSIIIFLALWF